MSLNMDSAGLQQNFLWSIEKKVKQQDLRKRFYCEKCRFSTKDPELFERHVAHHEEVTFACNLCSHISYSRVESQRHIVTHKGSYPYKCNWCPYGAVRRDYMVKHIQRIHGQPADGSFTTDCTQASAKTEHSSQQQTTYRYPDTPGTSGEPVKNIKSGSDSTENMFGLLPTVNQSRASAPYLFVRPVQQPTNNQTHLICSTTSQSVTSTACILPVTKNPPHSVYSSNHALGNVTHVIGAPLNVMVNEVDQRFTGKTSSANTLPRVHVSVPTDRTFQPKTLLQSQVGATAGNLVFQSKTVAQNQVLCVSADRAIQQQPMLRNQVRATTGNIVIQPKSVPQNQVGLPVGDSINLKTLLSKPVESSGQKAVEAQNVLVASPGERPVNSESGRNIPVSLAVQRSVPSGAHPSTPVRHCGQGPPSFTFKTPNTEKNSRRRPRPNILVKRPADKPESKQKSSQVQLLAPLNTPIQHNRPLTVSCPEKITIPAGCLFELVEVKNVNGTKELELRLVPQQPNSSSRGGSRNTAGTSGASGLSAKCMVATDNMQPKSLNLGLSSSQTNTILVPQIKGSHLKEHSADLKVDVKGEPEVNESVLGTKISATQAPVPSSGGFYGASRSEGRPLESYGVTHKLSAAYRNDANSTEPLIPIRQIQCRGRTISQNMTNTNVTGKSFESKISATKTFSIKHENVESSCQGLPVISSVFSLHQSRDLNPEATLNGEDMAVAQTLSVSGSNKTKDDLTVKTEEAKCVQKLQQNGSLLEHTNISDVIVPEKTDNVGKGYTPKGKVMSETCSSLTDTLQMATADPLIKMTVSPRSKNVNSTHEEDERIKESLLVQKDSPFDLAMNPTVALARIPSLDFYSFLESAKKVPEKAPGEESITARPVLCCTSNQQNIQEKSIKLVLKRKRSDSENNVSCPESQPVLALFDIQPPHRKRKKKKKRAKKNKSSEIKLDIHQVLVKSVGKLWLTPLKEDQLVKLPAPNQPVVILNHPNPLFQMVGVQTLKDCKWIASASSPHTHEDTPEKRLSQGPSFKMKLKKVQGQEYQVTELLLKGVSEK